MKKVEKVEAKGDLKLSIKNLVDGLGGFEKYVKQGDVVFIKPNFNTADPPPASTDINFLKAVVELVYDSGAKLVMIGESSTVTLNSKKVMEATGVYELLDMDIPPRIYVFEDGSWIKKSIKNARYLKSVHIPEIIERPDKIIYLPCLKTHKYAKFTGALKLSVGLMKPFERMALHARRIQEKIAELNTLIEPNLVIMDARKCFINEGPSFGDIEKPNIILASEGRAAIDIEGVRMIQKYKNNSLNDVIAEELPQINYALKLGIH